MSYTFDAKIAVGQNNVAGLTLITSITVGGVALYAPQTIYQYTSGQRRFRANGQAHVVGLRRVVWRSWVSLAQYNHLKTTYEVAGGVTVRTTTGGTAWSNWNAYVWFPDPAEMEYRVSATPSMPTAAYLLDWHFVLISQAT